eukprot:symbB.v1.2.013569.t1/scaffold963.1/size148485/9
MLRFARGFVRPTVAAASVALYANSDQKRLVLQCRLMVPVPAVAKSSGAWKLSLEQSPSIIDYGLAIRGFFKAAAWRQAMDLMQGMQRRRVQGNLVIYNSALRLGDSGNLWLRCI